MQALILINIAASAENYPLLSAAGRTWAAVDTANDEGTLR